MRETQLEILLYAQNESNSFVLQQHRDESRVVFGVVAVTGRVGLFLVLLR